MAEVEIINIDGEKINTIELTDQIFNVPVKKNVLHQVVTAQLAGRRSGTASVKRRSDVKGSRKKLFRQKGTGRARRGDIKSPLLRGGGVVFGPSPRSFDKKVPKKVKRLALKMALSSKLQEDDLLVVNNWEPKEIKTKDFVQTTAKLEIENALIITEKENPKLELSARNVSGCKILRCDGLNVYDILKYNKLVLLEPSVKSIEERLLV